MMEDTEAIARTAFRQAEKAGLLRIFVSNQRDEYIADLAFAERPSTSRSQRTRGKLSLS